MRTESEKSQQARQEEFQALVMQHLDSLYNTALRMTRNELDAEDLVQDVCVRAFRFFDKFRKDTNFKAWVFKILTNTYINRYRKKMSLPFQVELEKVSGIYVQDDYDLHNHTIENFKQRRYEDLFDDEIKAALDQLSDEFRIVVLLADVEDFSYKEIAKIVGCPLGTVMSRLSRGRRQLKNCLADYALENGFISRSN